MKQISVIGCGRWGTFLGWYMANYCVDKVVLYDIPTSPNFLELKETRKNSYLTLSDNMVLTPDLNEIFKNDDIIISIGCQHLRELAKQINHYNLSGKHFLLAMKGLEEPGAKILVDVMAEEIKQNDVHFACLGGPGHVQDYLKKVPSCAVIDSREEPEKKHWIELMQSELIRFYYGGDVVGNQIGAALKNVIGIAAGILDGLEWYGLKGALMARAPVEVGRFIKHFGGNPMSAYGLAHLGDYEATLFSRNSHNRMYGEMLAKGERFAKLAEGVSTLKAVKYIADRDGIEMPICQALYKVVFEDAPIKPTIRAMFEREVKREF